VDGNLKFEIRNPTALGDFEGNFSLQILDFGFSGRFDCGRRRWGLGERR
jgi:hypothetical protein